jgi:hypothetical protein
MPVLVGVLLVGVVQAPPADAAAQGLAISVPVSASLGSASPGAGSLTAVLGDVTVTTSSVLVADASWTVTVTASDFTTGGGSVAETVPAAHVSYLAGSPTTQTGLAAEACVPGQLAAVTLDVPRTAYSCTGLALLSSTLLTWRPQITIDIPAAAVAGAYAGTITHSVA